MNRGEYEISPAAAAGLSDLEKSADWLFIRVLYPQAFPFWLLSRVFSLAWFRLDRECLADALSARNDLEVESAIENFHYRVRNQAWRRWLRVRLSGRKVARLCRRLRADGAGPVLFDRTASTPVESHA